MPEPAGEGRVFLVGSGPGDPGLLTLKGRDLLASADLVVHDRLVNPALLKWVRPGARLVAAGGGSRKGSGSRRAIHRMLVDAARRGSRVVRLQAGDPFPFGRGGEEAEALARAGVPFEIVPGVSAALAVPGYAGIPLTHRRFASSVILLTDRQARRRVRGSIGWNRISGSADTLVILATMRRLDQDLRRLLEGGMSPATPAAVISWGTWPRQRVISAPLEALGARVRRAGLEAPAILIAGEVVRLRERLRWLEKRPLHGVRALVTRAADQAGPLRRELEGFGAEAIEVPMIETRPPSRWKPFDDAVGRIRRYDWLIFTSPNGVRYALDRMMKRRLDARILNGVRLAAIGPKTESTLRGRGLRADRIPGVFRSEGMLRAFRPREIAAKRFLLARGNLAGQWLPDELRRAGARVDQVEVYRTVRPRAVGRRLAAEMAAGAIDLITFTSSSTVDHFVRAVAPRRAAEVLSDSTVACIGPVTAETAREHGIRADVVSKVHTVPGLVRSIVAHFLRRDPAPSRSPAGVSAASLS